MSEETGTGKGAVLSVLFTIIGLVAARHPDWGRVVFISQHTAQFTELAGYAMAAAGQLGMVLSHPPAWLREPWDDLKQWVTATFRRRAGP